MGELYEPYPKLPKNIRQIGERDNIVRVYVEDYVNTYLKRLLPKGGQDLRAGLLLGNLEEHGGVPYVFIDGALEMEGITEEGEKVNFTEESWKKAYQSMEDLFPKRTVQGWFLCGLPGSALSPLNYWKQHGQYFSGSNKVMYLNSGLEGEEALYITSSDGFYKLRGHCIYYERNQMMQDYMVMQKDNHPVEAGGSDSVIRDFRRKMEKRKEQANSQNHTIQLLRGMCACLALFALAGAVAAFNSAEKMRDMEAVVASVLPDADAVANAGKTYFSEMKEKGRKEEVSSEAGGDFYDTDSVIIEEASGGVFPTAGSNRKESGSSLLQGESLSQETALQQPSESENGADGESRAPEEESPAEPVQAESSQAQVSNETAGSIEAESQMAESSQTDSSKAEEKEGEVQKAAALAMPRQLEPAPGQSVYVVQEGQTLYGICFELYQNLSKVEEICQINGLEDVNMLEAGRRLIVP